jgi:predicted phosphodiesterase
MRRLLQKLLLKPVLRLSARYSSKPEREKIFAALSKLQKTIIEEPGKRGIIIPFEINSGRFIIFSDQHRGAKNGADDFAIAEPNYLTALDYYYKNSFHFISLGDSEELWENSLSKVKKFNEVSIEKEKLFVAQDRFTKIFGNHDLYWDNDPLAWWQLRKLYGKEVKIYEGMILQLTASSSEFRVSPDSELKTRNSELTILLTHGHQGDASSDGNWFSKFFVARIWGPIQAYLRINPNTPAYDSNKKTLHNQIMYDWSSQQTNLILITGHTHQPVFESLTHLERLYKKLLGARKEKNATAVIEIEREINNRKQPYKDLTDDYLVLKPTYFNSGCCCFSDGDITGIEIIDGKIRLIKWNSQTGREVLEETALSSL